MYSGEFKFNGKYSGDMYGGMMCNDGSPTGREVGINYTTLKDKSNKNGYYNYYGTSRDGITFTSKISFQDRLGNARKLTPKQRKEVIEWLMPLDDEFKKLEVQDNTLIYYVKFNKLKWNEYDQGDILDLEVETDSAYAFSPTVEYVADNRVVGEKNMVIYNYSNVESHYSPYIKIISYGSGSITISNLNLSESMIIQDLKPNETITINCDKEWVQSDLVSYKYDKIKGVYLRLRYGKNDIKVSGKGFFMIIRCEYPMMME